MLHFDNSPLMIGVTGDRDFRAEEVPDLKERVRTLFRFLKSSGNGDQRTAKLEALVELLPKPLAEQLNPYRRGLEHWPSLAETPILILTSLAPGADSLVAEVALEDEFCNQEFHVIAPLPFPRRLYRRATTFRIGTRAEDLVRVRTYRRLLAQIGRHRTFCVRTKRDQHLAEKKFYERCKSELGVRKRRHERYYAAGEFIAAHVHLLIAIWDHQYCPDTSAGTPARVGPAAVVHARRHGHRIGTLPASNGLSQPHGGPIFHLVRRRDKNKTTKGPPEFVARFLHPASSTPDSSSERAQRRHQHVALALFTRIARNLEEFNKTACPGTPQADRELNKQLSWRPGKSKPKKRFSQVLLTKYGESDLHKSLRKLAVLRRRGSDYSRQLSSKGESTLRVMFFIAVAAAFLTHLFSEWHTQQHPPAEGLPVRLCLGLAGVAMGFAGIAWFWWRRPQRNLDRAHDYRALAEGSRVQLFWNLAGLGASVPANYMQRQRGELDWVRGAIRAASFPYERWRDRFNQLGQHDQVAAIRCVLQNWVQEQADYFVKSIDKHHHRLHFCQKLGGLLALSGLLGFVLLVISSRFSPELPLDWLQDRPWLGLLLTAITSYACWPIASFRLPLLKRAHSSSLDPYPKDPKTRHERILQKVNWLLHRVVPTTDRHTWQSHTQTNERTNLLLNFACFLVPATTLALLTATVGAVLGRWFPHTPDASVWTSVLLGTLLLSGALFVAWTEKNSDSELAYQYSTMAPMFRTAQLRLLPLVDQLDHAAQTRNNAAFEKTLQEIRAILYNIGVEALDENAEWLILHRARPLEPVMAG